MKTFTRCGYYATEAQMRQWAANSGRDGIPQGDLGPFLVTVKNAFDAFPHGLDEKFENVFKELRVISLQLKEGQKEAEKAFLFVTATGDLDTADKPDKEGFYYEHDGDRRVKKVLEDFIGEKTAGWTNHISITEM